MADEHAATSEGQAQDIAAIPDPTDVRYLTPASCEITLDAMESLHVRLADGTDLAGVYPVYAFPVACPDGFVSLVHSSPASGEREIGIIRDLTEFPEAQAELVRSALKRRYFVHTILQIRRIAWESGFVAFDVETDKGDVSFRSISHRS